MAGSAQVPGNALLSFVNFGTLNTKASRVAIKPEEFSWIENWMQLGDGNLRTLYGESGPLYTTTPPRTIIYHFPYNIGSSSYIAVFLDDGSAIQVAVSGGATTTIGGSGTFYTSGTLPACAQWESKYLLIVSNKATSSYWVWDGAILYAPGTLGPVVNLTDGGTGYTSPPTITAYNPSGSGATFTTTIDSLGRVATATITNPGSGFISTNTPTLGFSGGGSDATAVITPNVDKTSAGVAYVVIQTGGQKYTSGTYVTFSSSSGFLATGTVQAVDGVIIGVVMTNPGTDYSPSSPPTVTFTDPAGGSGGTGASAVAVVQAGQITGGIVRTGGSGYQGQPQITITGDGTGAAAHCTIVAGVVTAVVIDNPGLNYTFAKAEVSGSNNAAAAEVDIMPFGVAGSTIETYQDSVWIGNVTTSVFTAPDSVTDFSTADGGGAFPTTDSHLRQSIVCYRAANGFLYQFGDSSINVISNVQTSGSPATTTFSVSDIDNQVGTEWRDTVQDFGRAIVFANPSGVYALYGGAAEKVSAPLDRLFEKASFNTGQSGVVPTASVATIFGIRVYMLLFTTTDPYSGTLRNILAMWDGQKWFVGTQNVTPSIVSAQEINSTLSAWGSDGTHLYQLFSTPSSTLSKVWQGKLVAGDTGLLYEKQVNRLYVLAENNDTASATMAVAVDRINDQGAYYAGTANSLTIGAYPSRALKRFPISAYGVLVGMTGTTTSKDVTMIQSDMLYEKEFALFA